MQSAVELSQDTANRYTVSAMTLFTVTFIEHLCLVFYKCQGGKNERVGQGCRVARASHKRPCHSLSSHDQDEVKVKVMPEYRKVTLQPIPTVK